MIVLQLVLYCLLFTAMVKYAVRGGAINGLYFYPKKVQEKAIGIGLISRETMVRKRKIFMTEFYVVMLVALVLIIGLWNRISDFKTAYLQALLFLEVMNWYDGIIIDKVWVGLSSFWILPFPCTVREEPADAVRARHPGCEDIPYVQTWPQVLKKRCILTLIWVAGAAIVAGIVMLIFW